MQHGPTSRTFLSQRLRLHYLEWGNPNAPPLLHYSRELVVYLWSLDKVWGKLPVLEAAGVRTAEIV